MRLRYASWFLISNPDPLLKKISSQFVILPPYQSQGHGCEHFLLLPLAKTVNLTQLSVQPSSTARYTKTRFPGPESPN